MPRLALFHRSPITRRDDAALPHETVPTPAASELEQGPPNGVDGNSTPNGGR